jgi:hypothetical protein
MITECLAPLYVIMLVVIAQDVVISSLLLNFFSKVSMKIMSFSFNRVYDQALFFFLESFLIKTHKHIFEALHDLIDAIHLSYQNQFPYWSFENLIWRFDLKNNLMFIQKLYF